MALHLCLKLGEVIFIGDAVVTVTETRSKQVKLSIEAPKEIKIIRESLLKKDENWGNR